MLKFLKKMIGSHDAVGIDLGTTNSLIAVLQDGSPVVIQSEEGRNLTPSVVAYTSKGEVLVGDAAARQFVLNGHGTLFDTKRLIGRSFEQCKQTAFSVPYTVRPGLDKIKAVAEVHGRLITPEEAAAEVLGKLKRSAEAFLGRSISKCVITVPAYFDQPMREATMLAGKLAGFDVQALLNEPTAAALAYAQDLEGTEKVAVYDLGGGTFDISILDISGESEDANAAVKVMAVGGDPNLGGSNFDELLIAKLVSKFAAESGVNITENKEAMQRLRDAAQKAKIELSTLKQVDINLPFLTVDQSGPKHFSYSITRQEFEALIKPLVDKSIAIMKKTIEESGLSTKDLKVLLVGGSTRVPLVQKMVADLGCKVLANQRIDELVALGAALFAGIVKGDVQTEFQDVTSLDLGVQTIGDVMSVIIPKNTDVPCEKKDFFSPVQDYQTHCKINIYQGQDRKASANTLLGSVLLEISKPGPMKDIKVTITYAIDGNGILHVSAVDQEGAEQKVTFENVHKMDKREIKRIEKEQAMPSEQRQELNLQRIALSEEIKRIEEAAEEAGPKEKQKLLATIEEAEQKLQEEVSARLLTGAVQDIKRLADKLEDAQ
jgi:molecular chaperone DnaK